MKPWISPLLPGAVGDGVWPDVFERGLVASKLEALKLGTQTPSPLDLKRFEASFVSMKAMEYEYCVAQGVVPTRDEYHDWFNGLIWLAYPQAKSQINHLHVRGGNAEPFQAGNQRSRLRDAITLFDESGMVLITSNPDVGPALEAHDWSCLFVTLRQEWGVSILPFCFGHGLLDALRNPHKGLCAKVSVVQVDVERLLALRAFGEINSHPVHEFLDQVFLSVINSLESPRDLNPLPVMGIPAWFQENQSLGFYDDELVFRKKPTRKASK